jgi:CRP/FNR family transcriptional regulator, cyclic AMP receptor protein
MVQVIAICARVHARRRLPIEPHRRQLLRKIGLFSELHDDELDHIGAVARERACPAGEVLVRQGDSSGDLFSVVHGRLKVVSVGGDGEETLLSVMGAGDVFGEIALLDDEPRSATVIAAEPCRLLVVPRAAFRSVLLHMPQLALRLLALMARQVRRLTARAEDNTTLDVRTRLAKALHALLARFGVAGPGDAVRLTLRLSQQELGRMVGATREMVNKVLREWVARRIVKCVRGAVTQVDEPRLRAIAEGQPPPRRPRRGPTSKRPRQVSRLADA